jgi:hypothetical protein
MSGHEALERFYYWCAVRLWRPRAMMHAHRSPLTTDLIRSGSCPEAGSIPRHRSLTYRIVKEI